MSARDDYPCLAVWADWTDLEEADRLSCEALRALDEIDWYRAALGYIYRTVVETAEPIVAAGRVEPQ